MTVQEINEKRLKAIADARAISEAAGDKGLSAEDAAKFDAFMAEADRWKSETERAQRLEDAEAETRNAAPQTVARNADDGDQRSLGMAVKNARAMVATPQYRDAFWHAYRRGYDHISTEEKRALQVGNDAEGGYLVPDEFERTLIQALNEPVIMRKPGLATVISSVSGDKTIPIVSAHGSAGWTAEEVTANDSDETFSSKKFTAHKLTRIVKASVELVADAAFDLESYLRAEFARSFGAAEDAAFIAGTGASQPKGFTLSGESGLTAAGTTSVTADEIIRLKHALGMQYRNRAQWFMADGTVSAVARLKTGDGQYLWVPGLTANTSDTLLGRPVNVSSNMPAMTSTLKPIFFGDMSYYYIVDRAGIYFQVLRELYAATGQVAFLAYKRTDGQYILDEALQYITMA